MKKIIYNADIITMNAHMEIVHGGSIMIEDGKIKEIAQKKIEADGSEYTDAKGMIVMPGLINTHTHVPMTLLRGYADDLPLFRWLTDFIFPAEAKYMNVENERVASRLAFLEMIKSGTTCFNDMYFFEDMIATEAKKTGIRAVLSDSLIDFPTPSFKSVDEGMAIDEALIQKWQGDTHIHPSVCVHSPYTCCKETLQRTKAMADKYDTMLHIHVAETQKEVNDMMEQQGMTPVKYLDSIGLIDENVVAAHCVWLNDEDIALMAERKAKIAHCPKSNLKLASGIANVDKYRKAGITVGLGTDGTASNNTLDLVEEMKFAALLPKALNYDPEAMTARQALQMVTIDGARALGIGHITGSLEAGKEADLIMINQDVLNMTPMYDIYSALVYAMGSRDIHSSMVHGEWIMKNRVVLNINEEETLNGVRAIADTMRQ